MSRPIRVLVTGGRTYPDRERVFRELDAIQAEFGIAVVIEGGCRRKLQGRDVGADFFANQWAQQAEVPCFTFWARWRALGDVAGPERNERMIRMSRPHLGLVFPGGPGTAGCFDLLVGAGIPHRIIPKT